MGTARWEKEAQLRDDTIRLELARDQARRGLELAEAEVSARIAVLQRELEARRADFAVVESESSANDSRARETRGAIQQRRSGAASHGDAV